MAFVLIGLGVAMAYLEYLGTANVKGAGKLLYAELFSGSNPFYKWAGAMLIIGLIGYIPEMEPISMAFLVLVLVVIILHNQSGFTTLIKGV